MPTKLLVSVRNRLEAEIAMAGGADYVDVKEPSRGPLGAADHAEVHGVLSIVAGRRPVTAALGELSDWCRNAPVIQSAQWELAMLKVGLASYCNAAAWELAFAGLRGAICPSQVLVPVAYADCQTAGSPEPEAVLAGAIRLQAPWLMIDTFDKSVGDLFAILGADRIINLVSLAHESGVKIALAGSLSGHRMADAAATGADVIGVRGAVCDQGRLGAIKEKLVAQAKRQLQETPADLSL